MKRRGPYMEFWSTKREEDMTSYYKRKRRRQKIEQIRSKKVPEFLKHTPLAAKKPEFLSDTPLAAKRHDEQPPRRFDVSFVHPPSFKSKDYVLRFIIRAKFLEVG